MLEEMLNAAADPRVMRARGIPGSRLHHERRTDREPRSFVFHRHGAAYVERALLSSANSNRPSLKSVGDQTFELAFARHRAHHSCWCEAVTHRNGHRTRYLNGLGDAKRHHRLEHLLRLRIIPLAAAERIGLI